MKEWDQKFIGHFVEHFRGDHHNESNEPIFNTPSDVWFFGIIVQFFTDRNLFIDVDIHDVFIHIQYTLCNCYYFCVIHLFYFVPIKHLKWTFQLSWSSQFGFWCNKMPNRNPWQFGSQLFRAQKILRKFWKILLTTSRGHGTWFGYPHPC